MDTTLAPPAPSSKPAAAAPVVAAPPATLLFVDDEPAILSALRRLLRPLGHRVLLAESGAEALEILEKEPVDLVMSDMRMPQMDGAQLLQIVRQRWPDAMRLLLTGYADISSTIAAINQGEIHRYISKPWDDQELLLSLREALDRHRLAHENRILQKVTAEQYDQLQTANAKLDEMNRQLEGNNAQLEKRVASRTAELSQVNDMLGAAYQQLQTNFMLSIKVFAGLLELREGSLPGFSEKVGSLSQRLALKLGLSESQRTDCYAAGLLCEIGKIGLPDRMLRKAFSAMDDEERKRYCRHPLMAEAALMPLNDLRSVSRLVRQHQERVDGRGYPDGLSGDDVPIQAQLIGLAATYEGLMAGRLAEKRYTPEEAQEAIIKASGSHYSPALVDAFKKVMADAVAQEPPMREVKVNELAPGMVMGRDLISPRGTLLLSKGYMFDAAVIRTLNELVRREGLNVSFFVRTDMPKSASTAVAA
ncbi:HD domain-containing phosphohydrolase [Roseateles sp. BYS87W]|uniref:HD domain-containing phosphohydrolase n=1 Tax=Pelomonas baiyunensis TaxID=3299026 RepID=A0ABW7H0Y4_9BURK